MCVCPKPSEEELLCNLGLLLVSVEWSFTDSKIKAKCSSCSQRMSLLSAHTLMIRKQCLHPSEVQWTQSDITHPDRHVLVHAHTNKERSGHLQHTGRPNCYQLPYINKSLHKSSDDSATLNTLEMLPGLAGCRRPAQIGRRAGEDGGLIGRKTQGRWGDKERKWRERWVTVK